MFRQPGDRDHVRQDADVALCRLGDQFVARARYQRLDLDIASARRDDIERRREQRIKPDRIEHQIDPARRPRAKLARDVAAAIVDRDLGAEAFDIIAVGRAAGNRDTRTERFRHLDTDAADPARAAVDQHRLARTEFAGVDDPAIGGRPCDRQRRRLREAPRQRQRREEGGVGDAIFGIGAVETLPLPRHAEDAVAGQERVDAFAHRLDEARKIEAKHEGEMIVDIGRQLALTRLPVGGVHARAHDAD